MADFWDERRKFEKTGQFILRDWTKHNLILDLTNSLGEKYHFRIEPEADANSVPTRPAGNNVVLHMNIPIASPTPPLEKDVSPKQE